MPPFLKVYLTVAWAELGDKTNLTTMAFAATMGKWTVITASSLALITVTIIGGFAGDAITGKIAPHRIELGAGALFIIIGMIKFVPALAKELFK